MNSLLMQCQKMTLKKNPQDLFLLASSCIIVSCGWCFLICVFSLDQDVSVISLHTAHIHHFVCFPQTNGLLDHNQILIDEDVLKKCSGPIHTDVHVHSCNS